MDRDCIDAFPWHIGIYDAHCHPTDTMSMLKEIPKMKTKILTIMATRSQDQTIVAEVADQYGLADRASYADIESCRVIPSFGWHPWFSHLLYDDTQDIHQRPPEKKDHYGSVITPCLDDDDILLALPDPRPLSDYLKQTRAQLSKYPLALVGEVGLDQSFRIPESRKSEKHPELVEQRVTLGGREGRKLSNFRVCLDHQRTLFKAQLALAAEMERAVSIHGVAAHGAVFNILQDTWKNFERQLPSKRLRKLQQNANGERTDDTVQSMSPTPKPYPPRICLHSYSGPLELLKQYLHPSVPVEIFFSFSQVINFSTVKSAKTIEIIKSLPHDRILIESDLHCAGDRMDNLLEEMAGLICQIKEWALEDGVEQLARNWAAFALG